MHSWGTAVCFDRQPYWIQTLTKIGKIFLTNVIKVDKCFKIVLEYLTIYSIKRICFNIVCMLTLGMSKLVINLVL